MRVLLAASLLLAFGAVFPAAAVEAPPPVKELGAERLQIVTPVGNAELPVYLSRSWDQALSGITRAVIVVHGLSRDADTYFAAAESARANAGEAGQNSLIIAPQFLADADIDAYGLPASMLRWHWSEWGGGGIAHGPIRLSSFAVIDALLARLADRARFPDLAKVVVAGFSAGGQVVQRYAVLGQGEAALAAASIATRYVVGSPSSYLYFSPERLDESGRIGAFAGAATCPGYNHWRYGFSGALPAYVTDPPASLEERYVGRDVVYLLGTADTDPQHRSLDTSCGAEAQGPHRYARGLAYFRVLQLRHPGTLTQTLWEAPGIAHQGGRVFNSPCGLAALFDQPGCPAR
ncbi:MAG: alpha/beta hydrolase [Proteobacteria bacterium]|nr:alpha/beta hydrolase [Pseudomonadota bacterium]MBI3497652.1 alpha/beta hydrolase [Pseudomonadota bacterium]